MFLFLYLFLVMTLVTIAKTPYILKIVLFLLKVLILFQNFQLFMARKNLILLFKVTS